MIKWLHEFQDVGEQKIHKTLVKKEFTTVQRGVPFALHSLSFRQADRRSAPHFFWSLFPSWVV